MYKLTKTLISFILCGCVLFGLIGCNKDSEYELNGIDTAKLLLANERLDSQVFKSSDSILISGKSVFDNLYSLAEENMVKYGDNVQTLSASESSSA